MAEVVSVSAKGGMNPSGERWEDEREQTVINVSKA
jgi:hypothetical protein